MNGIKLFVDDLRECPQGWHLVRSITDAIRILATMPVDAVSLDHDIIRRDYSGKLEFSEETFEPIARYIALMPEEDRPRVVFFHTANPHGAIKMGYILEDTQKDLRTISCDDYKAILEDFNTETGLE